MIGRDLDFDLHNTIQELIAEGMHGITRYSPEGDKQMRLYAQTATMENGFVYLPRDAPWLADYVHEITIFPNSKYDDQADSTSQALNWLTARRPANRPIVRRGHNITI